MSSSKALNAALAVSLGALALTNVYIATHLYEIAPLAAAPAPVRQYSYEKFDFPYVFMTDEELGPPVAMTVEETVHYELDPPMGQDDWDIEYEYHSWNRIGPEKRVFITALYHELHCLRYAHRRAFPFPPGVDDGHQHEGPSMAHVQHCLNFIRQLTLCDADLTLEPPDVLDRDWETNRRGATYVCRNWERALNANEENYLEWKAWSNQFNANYTPPETQASHPPQGHGHHHHDEA